MEVAEIGASLDPANLAKTVVVCERLVFGEATTTIDDIFRTPNRAKFPGILPLRAVTGVFIALRRSRTNGDKVNVRNRS